jgi:hypothetical protein
MPDVPGVFPLDEFPIHQIPAPIEWVGSDRNFYDRSYWNAHDRSGEIMLITGIGYYPNLGNKDAFFLVRRGDQQTALHFGDKIDSDRLNQRCGNYRIEVIEQLKTSRIVIEETEGIAVDMTWRGLFPAIPEQRHIMRTGGLRATLDAQRFAQVGSWEGILVIDGQEYPMTPDVWRGTRDRSWGIRPLGEAEPAGRPADPPFDGMWWLYVPIAFEEFAMIIIIQEEPDGHRILNDCHRVWPDGRTEQLGWPLITTNYRSGTRTPLDGTISFRTPDGTDVVVTMESLLPLVIHVGGGYGGDSDWTHGQWRGEGWSERVTYDMTAADVVGRTPFGLTDSVGRATWREAGQEPKEGWGLYEHGVIGIHRPTGFNDWFTNAP